MENKLFRNSVSTLLVVVMVMSVLSIITFFDNDGVFADEGKGVNVRVSSTDNTFAPLAAADPAYNANAALNKHTFTKYVKVGKWNPIFADGHRYDHIVNTYQTYGRDITKYVAGEEYFMPASITVTGKNLNRTFNYSTYSTSPGNSTRYGVELKSTHAGKFTITTQFRKCYVDTSIGTTVYFKEQDATRYPVTDTFYVQAKIKFKNNKKKGKLAKSKKTTWKNPTEKYGKLPKPKAKKGYKFKGWYTKKSGGKKVKKSTKVPTQNTVTLYARYVKK